MCLVAPVLVATHTYMVCSSNIMVCSSNIMGMRTKYKDAFLKKHGIKLGFMSAFVRACSYALENQPVVNAVIDEKEIVYRDYVDISVAVATPRVCIVGTTVMS